MTFDPSRIPTWLQRTPEQQAGDDALQKRLRETYGPGRRLTPTERHLQRAVAVERSAVANLNHLTQQPDADPKHIRQASAQLAEARADQGHYLEAAAIHPDPKHAQRFADIASAIERPDDDDCGCQPEQKRTVEGKPVTIHAENISEMVMDPRHGTLQPLHRCKCGALNVKAAKPELQKRIDRVHANQREARN